MLTQFTGEAHSFTHVRFKRTWQIESELYESWNGGNSMRVVFIKMHNYLNVI